MTIESRTLKSEDYKEWLNFGWECSETYQERVARGHHRTVYVLVRNKEMPNYDQITQLERQYFSLKAHLKHYEEADPFYVLIGIICLIIPGIIYLSYKSNQRKEYSEFNTSQYNKMKEIALKAKSLL